jgi:hypothetical protein
MTALNCSNPVHAPDARDLHLVDFVRRENACHPRAIGAAMLKWTTPTHGAVPESSMERP